MKTTAASIPDFRFPPARAPRQSPLTSLWTRLPFTSGVGGLIPPSLLAALVLASAAPVAHAEDHVVTTAVFSHVSNGYQREKRPDGSYKPEYYAVKFGGYMPGEFRDRSIDGVKFSEIAGQIGKHLAAQNYVLADNAQSAQLLLSINWGTTIPYGEGMGRSSADQTSNAMSEISRSDLARPTPGGLGPVGQEQITNAISDVAMANLDSALAATSLDNTTRDMVNSRNATLLGYAQSINEIQDLRYFGRGRSIHDELIADVEDRRYFIVVTAFDFKAATQQKKLKYLWSTRVSLSTTGNRFDTRLATMIANAAKHFGRESGRLVRESQTAPRVDIGDVKYLELATPSSAPAPQPTPAK